MKNRFSRWRFYTLGKARYCQCMGTVFNANLNGLCQINAVIAVLVCVSTFFPMIIEQNFQRAVVYIAVAAVALLVSVLSARGMARLKKGIYVSRAGVYALIMVYYINLIFFGLYLDVFTNPNVPAGLFLCFLVCALFLFTTPPQLSLFLTLASWAVFLVSAILVKPPELWFNDLFTSMIAVCMGPLFGWHIATLRMAAAAKAMDLEDERDSYYTQSTEDELTRLKNRRDFTQTFGRYLHSPRRTDDFLCLAILDVDHFKDYNDYYGHAQGDECLRAIGRALNGLKSDMTVYAARVGGEEFALIWFVEESTNIEGDVERIHRAVADLKLPHAKSNVSPLLTVSIGVHVLQCGSTNDMRTVYELADQALYSAKQSGRNRTVIHDARQKKQPVTGAAD